MKASDARCGSHAADICRAGDRGGVNINVQQPRPEQAKTTVSHNADARGQEEWQSFVSDVLEVGGRARLSHEQKDKRHSQFAARRDPSQRRKR